MEQQALEEINKNHADFTRRVKSIMSTLGATFAACFQLYAGRGLFVNATDVALCELFIKKGLNFICPMPDTLQSAFHYVIDEEQYEKECEEALAFNLHLGVNFVVSGERGYDILHLGFEEKDSAKLLNSCMANANILYQTLEEQVLTKGLSKDHPLPLPEGLVLPTGIDGVSPELLPPALAQALAVYRGLNKTQQSIIIGLINGKAAKMIAHELNRSVRTVENQVFNLRQEHDWPNLHALLDFFKPLKAYFNNLAQTKDKF